MSAFVKMYTYDFTIKHKMVARLCYLSDKKKRGVEGVKSIPNKKFSTVTFSSIPFCLHCLDRKEGGGGGGRNREVIPSPRISPFLSLSQQYSLIF